MKKISYHRFPRPITQNMPPVDDWQKRADDCIPFAKEKSVQSPAMKESEKRFFFLIDDQLYTPVHAIMGFVQMIEIDQSPKQRAYCCEAMVENSWLFIEMLEKLLASLDGASLTIGNEELLPFTVLINHELRTPFNAIIGLSQLLKETECSVDYRDYCEDIQASCLRVFTHLDNLLEFARLSRGTTHCSIPSASVEKTVLGAIHHFRSQAHFRQLDFNLSLKEEPLATICLDNHLLKGALNRLLDNAIKFTSEGYVSINIEKYYDFVEQQWRLKFQIEDSGIGVEPNKLHLIFAPFQQSDSSTTRCFEGLGLGLAIAQKQIELLGGTIVCSDNIERGMTFEFSIPCSEACVQKPEQRCA